MTPEATANKTSSGAKASEQKEKQLHPLLHATLLAILPSALWGVYIFYNSPLDIFLIAILCVCYGMAALIFLYYIALSLLAVISGLFVGMVVTEEVVIRLTKEGPF